MRKESSVRYKCLADCVQFQLVIWTVSPVLPRKYWDKEWVTPLGCFSSLALNTSQTQESFEVNFMKWNHMMPLYKQNKLNWYLHVKKNNNTSRRYQCQVNLLLRTASLPINMFSTIPQITQNFVGLECIQNFYIQVPLAL